MPRVDAALGELPAERLAPLAQVAHLGAVLPRVVVGHRLERGVGDRELEPVAERAQLGDVHVLDLVRPVRRLGLAEVPALDRVREDDRRPPAVLDGRLVRGVDLEAVVAAAAQAPHLVVVEVRHERQEAGVGAEQVLADVRAALGAHLLEVPVEQLVQPPAQEPLRVVREQRVPLAAPHDLDDVPARAAEDGLELLDDLPVAAHRAVEPLQVAVDDPDEVVEPFARRDRERAERLGLVGLAVADERPHPRLAGVLDAARVEVAVEPRLVDRRDRAEPHRDRRELPVVGHQPRVRVRGEPLAAVGLAPEVLEARLVEAPLEERARVDPGRHVPLVEDLVAVASAVLAAEEVVERDVVELGGRRERRQVAADPVRARVRPHHHERGVPPEDRVDLLLELLVSGVRGLVLDRDRVDVVGRQQLVGDEPAPARLVEQHREQVPRAVGALGARDRPDGVDPLPRLLGVHVLLHGRVEGHVGGSSRRPRSRETGGT